MAIEKVLVSVGAILTTTLCSVLVGIPLTPPKHMKELESHFFHRRTPSMFSSMGWEVLAVAEEQHIGRPSVGEEVPEATVTQ